MKKEDKKIIKEVDKPAEKHKKPQIVVSLSIYMIKMCLYSVLNHRFSFLWLHKRNTEPIHNTLNRSLSPVCGESLSNTYLCIMLAISPFEERKTYRAFELSWNVIHFL